MNFESLYIHIPFCFSKCRYCDFFSIPGEKQIPDLYIKALCNELSWLFYKNQECRLLKTIYIGGGTPSLLNSQQLASVFSTIKKYVKLDASAEITIEVNPDDVTEAFLFSLQKNGINRVSCGIQTLNQKALEFSGRRADRKQNIRAIQDFQKYWNKKLSLDLICGLPFETKNSFEEGLKIVSEAGADHISMYSLTFEDSTPFGKLLNEGKLDYDFEKSDDLWLFGREYLENKGFLQYEVSNFSKKGFESLHNLAYWTHKPYAGAGCGATGTFYYADGSGIRYSNKNDVKKYIDFWIADDFRKVNGNAMSEVVYTEPIDFKTSQFEYFMMGLRKLSGINQKEYENIFDKKIPENFKSLCKKWQKNDCGLITKKNDFSFTLGKNGILFLNRFLEEMEL